MNISGRLKITDKNGVTSKSKGRIKCPDVLDSQLLEVEGDISFKRIVSLSGNLRGKIKGSDIEIKNLTVDGSIRVESIISDNCMMQLNQHNKIGKINSKKIEISNNRDNNSESIISTISRFLGRRKEFDEENRLIISIGDIIAEEVLLVQCSCDRLVCSSAILREGCKVKELIYTDNLDVDETVQIEKIVHKST